MHHRTMQARAAGAAGIVGGAVSTLRLHIEGPKEGISFASFVRLLNRSLYILRATDSAVTGRMSGVLDWVVVDLGSAEGLDAVIRSKPRGRRVVDEHTAQRIAASYVDALDIAERGEVLPPHLSDNALEHLVQLAKGLHRNGAEALRTTHVEEEQAATVSPTTAENVERLRKPRSRAIGSIIGRLEVISVHYPPQYHVYDEVTKRPVRCAFADEDLTAVTAALAERVMVAGIIHRNAKGQPLRVEQPRLALMLADADLPSTSDLVGVAPDLTDQRSTEEHLRRLRDG
jgi:hypothetical protein